MKLTLTFASLLLVTAAALSATSTETKITGDLPYVSKIEGSCKDREHTFLMTIQHDAYDSAKYGVMNLYVYEGPLGKGYIPSRVTYEQAKAYVCKETRAQWLPDDNMGE
jgi:hypothetical protein